MSTRDEKTSETAEQAGPVLGTGLRWGAGRWGVPATPPAPDDERANQTTTTTEKRGET
jgi:hypothetical protein